MKKFVPGNWLFALLLMLLSAVLYGPFLHNPLVFDDTNFLAYDLGTISPLQTRWLPYATIAWTVGAVAENMPWLRLEALLLHGAVGITLFFLLQRIYQHILSSGHPGRDIRLLAFCSACLFVLHPVAVYGAGYLIQRTTVMATLFGLLALLAYLHGSIRNKPLWLWMSVPLYYLTVFSKEHAIMLPAVMLALTVLLHDDWRAKLRQRWTLFAALAVIALFVVAAQKGIMGSVLEPVAPLMLEDIGVDMAYSLSILTQSWLFFKYIGLWLLPNPAWMSVDMREPFAASFFSIFGLSALAFIGYGLIAIRLLFRRGPAGIVGFAMLFPWLLFFTEFSTVRIQESFVLYRSYLWMTGIFIVLPLLFGKFRLGIAIPLMLAVMFAFGMGAVNRLTTFSSSVLLWSDAAKLVGTKHELPGVWRIYENRAIAFLQLNQTQQAHRDYRLALSLAPRSGQKYLYQGVGAAYFQDGRYAEALASFDQALELDGRYDQARYGRGLAHMLLGNRDAALDDFTVVCQAGRRVACDKLAMLREQ